VYEGSTGPEGCSGGDPRMTTRRSGVANVGRGGGGASESESE